MRRTAPWILLLALVSGLTAMAPVASADSHRDDRDSVEATSFNALVGAETPVEGVQALAFLPEGVTVHVGGSITWDFPDTRAAYAVVPPARPDAATGCHGACHAQWLYVRWQRVCQLRNLAEWSHL